MLAGLKAGQELALPILNNEKEKVDPISVGDVFKYKISHLLLNTEFLVVKSTAGPTAGHFGYLHK